jgi:hypothetical protein
MSARASLDNLISIWASRRTRQKKRRKRRKTTRRRTILQSRNLRCHRKNVTSRTMQMTRLNTKMTRRRMNVKIHCRIPRR